MEIFLLNDIVKGNSEINYAFHRNPFDLVKIHGHDFFEIFLITNGEVIHNLNGKSSRLTTGTLCLIRSQDVHFYERYEDKGCDYINLAFSKETFKKYAGLIGTPRQIEVLLDTENNQIQLDPKFLEQIIMKNASITGYRHPGQMPHHRVAGMLFDMIGCLFDGMENNPLFDLPLFELPYEMRGLYNDLSNPDFFEKGLRWIFGRYPLSYEHYCRMFGNHFNQTPTDFFNNAKMNYARNLLIFTNYSIIDICLNCGFENMGHFYGLFSKAHGTTPAKFRKLHKQLHI